LCIFSGFVTRHMAAILVVLIQSDFMFGGCLDQISAAMPNVLRYFVVAIISSKQLRHEGLILMTPRGTPTTGATEFYTCPKQHTIYIRETTPATHTNAINSLLRSVYAR
jgi:hypothetical protein